MKPRHIALLIAAAVGLVVVVIFYSQMLYTLDATHIAVLQRPFTGALEVQSSPGTYNRLGSRVTEYNKRDFYSFNCDANPVNDNSIQVRFNDGGHASVCGNVSWEMPSNTAQVVKLHTLFGSQDAIDRQLVKTAVSNAMYQTSPLMSSTESYAARRNEFLQLFADQVQHGIYSTVSNDVLQPDPITGEKKMVKVVTLVPDKAGGFMRTAGSPLTEFGINILPPTINNIIYDPEVEKQIQQQRENILAIQTSQAEAKKAEQAKITAQANGETQVMIAKMTQDVQKAQAEELALQQKNVAETAASRDKSVAETAAARDKNVAATLADQQKVVAETAAQRDLNVAVLSRQAAEQIKQHDILIGEGQAQARQLLITADGALSAKLETYLKVNGEWAQAFANYKGNVVPQMVMGASGTTTQTGNAAQDFMSLMSAKAARDLSLDLGVSSQKQK